MAINWYINIKWQALPPITKRWKISWEPKLICLALNPLNFNAYKIPPTVCTMPPARSKRKAFWEREDFICAKAKMHVQPMAI